MSLPLIALLLFALTIGLALSGITPTLVLVPLIIVLCILRIAFYSHRRAFINLFASNNLQLLEFGPHKGEVYEVGRSWLHYTAYYRAKLSTQDGAVFDVTCRCSGYCFGLLSPDLSYGFNEAAPTSH